MKTPCDHYVRDLLFELIHRGRAVCETVRANKQSGEGDRAEFAAGHATTRWCPICCSETANRPGGRALSAGRCSLWLRERFGGRLLDHRAPEEARVHLTPEAHGVGEHEVAEIVVVD